MDLEPAAAAADAGEERSLANLPPELVLRIGTGVGFVHVGGLARSCRAYAGLTRDLAAREDLLRPTLHATAGPHWLPWLVQHAQALRSRGASEAALARAVEPACGTGIEEGAGRVEGEAAVRLLGLAVQHGELGLFRGAGGVDATLPLLQQRARTAAVLAAPLPQPQPQQAATPHLAALEWHCRQQQLAAADPPYIMGAVASLAEPAAAEADLAEVECVLDIVCEGGQAAVLLLQLLLARDAFLARLDSLAYMGAYIIMEKVCLCGQVELLRLLLACDAYMARLPDYCCEALIRQQARMGGQVKLLQLLLACDALVERLDTQGAYLVMCEVCDQGGQEAAAGALRQLLACDTFLARLDWQAAFDVMLQVCYHGRAGALRQLLACEAFMARLGDMGTRLVLGHVGKRCQAEVQQQLGVLARCRGGR